MRIFVVDDDPFYASLIKHILEKNPDNVVRVFEDGKSVLDELYTKPDAITIDYSLPDMTGKELLRKVSARLPHSKSVIISSQEDISTAISMLKEGAYDYLVKDDEIEGRLWNTFKNLSDQVELQEEVEILRNEISEHFNFSKTIIGESTAIKKCLKIVEKAARTSINATITGETGTGKELVANAIHFNSERKGKKFVPVNMAAIPNELIESELFGHEKGAFTGAVATRIGKFEEADGGTIFLDEIAEMELNMQTKLLRVIQEGELVRVGGNKPIKFNVRIITATHKNILEEVKKKTFRQDLYYRLIGLPIELPPLRDRENDILILAKTFLDTFSKKNKTPNVLSKDAKKKMLTYPFPGNVRELKSIIELSAVMAEGDIIEAEDITFNRTEVVDDLLLEEKTLKVYNQIVIQHFLDKYNFNVVKVAEKLDIGKSTIYQMIKNKELTTK